MSEQQFKDKNNLWEQIKKLWLPISGFIGAITLIVNFYELWLGNKTFVNYVALGLGLVIVIIILGWVGFKTTRVEISGVLQPGKKRIVIQPTYPPKVQWAARITMFFMIVGVLVSFNLLTKEQEEKLLEQQNEATLQAQSTLTAKWISQTQIAQNTIVAQQIINTQQSQSTQVAQVTQQALRDREGKLIVLIAKFEGPDDNYGLRNEILAKLRENFIDDPNVQIETIDEVITLESNSGSLRARELGQMLQADIVIWGSYFQTEDPRVRFRIENLSPEQIYILENEDVYEPQVTLDDLKSAEFQVQAGREVSGFISFLTGYIKVDSEDYASAIPYFDYAIDQIQNTDDVFDYGLYVYIWRGLAKYAVEDCESAIVDYTNAIAIDPTFAAIYFARGVCYSRLENYGDAIRDLDIAIQLLPDRWLYYYERARANYFAFNLADSLGDYDKSLELNPTEEGFIGRGGVFIMKLDFISAVDSYSEAIKINPNSYDGFNGRGTALAFLRKHKDAIIDFTKAIEIDSQKDKAYANRASSYQSLKKFPEAIKDATIAIELNPQNISAYQTRANAYFLSCDFQNAASDYSFVINKNSQNAIAFLNRGISYYELGEDAKAEEDFQKYEQLTGKKPDKKTSQVCHP